MVKFLLQIKGGKYATLLQSYTGPQLRAVEQQYNGKNVGPVHILKLEGGSNHQLAFCFMLGQEGYSLQVDDNKLKLQKTTVDTFLMGVQPCHKFQKINKGEYYCLRSVVKPNKYLSINNRDILTLSSHQVLFNIIAA